MSTFIGKIHYWLYEKILLQEKLIDNIIAFTQNNGVNCDRLVHESNSRYGNAIKGELESQIDHGNIHGWLQKQIISVETRIAFIITELLKSNTITKDQIDEIFYQSAYDTMRRLDLSTLSVQDLFKLIFDYVLEGMPCDNVIEVIENNETYISWKITQDLHEGFWRQVGGDPQNHHRFRDAWIKGFIHASGNQFRYLKIENNISAIERI